MHLHSITLPLIILFTTLFLGLLTISGCGGSASAELSGLLPVMRAEIEAMPGFEVEPDTILRFAEESHPGAVEKAFVGDAGPEDAAALEIYAVEVYRGMVDHAFSEGRTDLSDILTRAYMAAAARRAEN